jgi:hypothetical protein
MEEKEERDRPFPSPPSFLPTAKRVKRFLKHAQHTPWRRYEEGKDKS